MLVPWFPKTNLVEKPDGHLLVDIGAVQRLAEVLERDLALATQIRLQNRPLGNAHQLVLADVRPHHHMQNGEQLVPTDHTIIVQIVHLKGELQLLLAAVQLALLVVPQRSEMGQDVHKLPEVDPVVIAFREEGVHYPLAQRVDRQLRNAHKVLPGQSAAVVAIQGSETGVQSLDLVGGKASFLLDLSDFLVTQEQRRFIAHDDVVFVR